MVNFKDIPPEIRQCVFKSVFGPKGCFFVAVNKHTRSLPTGETGLCDSSAVIPQPMSRIPFKSPVWQAWLTENPQMSIIVAPPEIKHFVPFERVHRHAQVLRVCKQWYAEAFPLFVRCFDVTIYPSGPYIDTPDYTRAPNFLLGLPWSVRNIEHFASHIGLTTVKALSDIRLNVLAPLRDICNNVDGIHNSNVVLERTEEVIKHHLVPFAQAFANHFVGLETLELFRSPYDPFYWDIIEFNHPGFSESWNSQLEPLRNFIKSMLADWIKGLPGLRVIKFVPTLEQWESEDGQFQAKWQAEIEEFVAPLLAQKRESLLLRPLGPGS